MFELNYLAILAATVAAFVMGAVWNGALFGDLIMKLRAEESHDAGSTSPPVWKLATEFGRCFVIAVVLAYLLTQLGTDSWIIALQVGALVWLGFPAMILVGAVVWENVPVRLALVHAGDWLLKLMAMGVILSLWQ